MSKVLFFSPMILSLIQQTGINVSVALILSKLGFFTQIIGSNKKRTLKKSFFPLIILGTLGIVGTLTGFPTNGAIVNGRIIPIFIGGLMGGPLVGILSGALAGVHRWLFDLDGPVAFAAMVATILEGAFAGYLSPFFYKSSKKIKFTFISTALAELFQMFILLILARPLSRTLNIISIIALPMIIFNGIGTSLIILIFENLIKDKDKLAAQKSLLGLEIAEKTLPFLKQGLNFNTAQKTVEIIYSMMEIKGAAITDTEKILGFIGPGKKKESQGEKITLNIIKNVLKTQSLISINNSDLFQKHTKNLNFSSTVIAPLLQGEKSIGTLLLFKGEGDQLNRVDTEITKGLSQLFSTQLELSRLDQQEQLLKEAELRVLQAQINPHFLFNTLNTISSFIRTNPGKGRELITHLSQFYRTSLNTGELWVPLETEINHIKSYLAIEKARFGSRLSITYSIENGLNPSVPPLILQPLVENSIIHGIQSLPQGGSIKIKAVSYKRGFILQVEDSGKGIEKKYIPKLIYRENKKSIGLANINSRIKNAYGEKANLLIESKKAGGTLVQIIIPVGRIISCKF